MKKFKVGLQLYSVRNEMSKDFEGTLKKVKEIGYDYVEFAGYFGKSADEVKAILDKYDLKALSVHQTHDVFLGENYQESIDYLKTIGVKYSIIPWVNRSRYDGDEYKKLCEEIKIASARLKENGLVLGYHNHDFEFDIIDNVCIIDRLYSDFSAKDLNAEFDTCWVTYAGYDASEYILKYASRERVLHLKDFTCKQLAQGPQYALIDSNGKAGKTVSKEENAFDFRPVGSGLMNFDKILEAASKTDIECVIVEQDMSKDGEELKNAEISRNYLKKFNI